MYQITSGARGGGLPAGLGVYEFIFRMDEGSESYMNFQSKRGGDNSGGERVVESISLLERRIHLRELKSSSPVLVQTSHPPTRNLFGKTHCATTAVTHRNG